MSAAPLRVLIVDDEPLARARAARMLAETGAAVAVAQAGSAAEARTALGTHPIDVVLLDVQMPGEDGFALLASLERRPAVVFVTAYDRYAVQAFEENAVDYLLKPFRAERLARALERARTALARPDAVAAHMAALLESVRAGARPVHLERLTVRVGVQQKILRADHVLWFGAEDKLVFADLGGPRHYVPFTLEQLEQRLDPARFARIHRGIIANLDHAAALKPGFAGTWRLQLDDAARTELPVSRARARGLRTRLGATR